MELDYAPVWVMAGEDVARTYAENWRRHAGHSERYEGTY